MNETILKPCPFCGKSHMLRVMRHSGMLGSKNVITHWVKCNECGGCMRQFSREAVIYAWNQRHAG